MVFCMICYFVLVLCLNCYIDTNFTSYVSSFTRMVFGIMPCFAFSVQNVCESLNAAELVWFWGEDLSRRLPRCCFSRQPSFVRICSIPVFSTATGTCFIRTQFTLVSRKRKTIGRSQKCPHVKIDWMKLVLLISNMLIRMQELIAPSGSLCVVCRQQPATTSKSEMFVVFVAASGGRDLIREFRGCCGGVRGSRPDPGILRI